MRCPRCGLESGERAAFCAGCGAPLALRDEPVARPLDAPLRLDRRGPSPDRPVAPDAPTRRVPEPPAVAPPPARTSPLPPEPTFAPRGAVADPDASHWDLGPALRTAARQPGAPEIRAGVAEPGGARRPAVDTGAFRWREPGAPSSALHDARAHAEVRLRRGSGVRRAVAWAIDVLPLAAAVAYFGRSLVGSAEAALPAPPTGLDGLVDLVVREAGIVVPLAGLLVVAVAVYATLAHALAGATLGKWILGLRVVGPDGAKPSLARSTTRSLLAVVSAALLGLGFLLALFTRSGRALHDLLARTWVVEAP